MIIWTSVARGRKADRGHTVTWFGYSDNPRRQREFLKCQCGKQYSGIERSRAWRTWEKHRERELAKLDA